MRFRSLSGLFRTHSKASTLSAVFEHLERFQRVMSAHPTVCAVLWHVPTVRAEAYAPQRWFVPEDLVACEQMTNTQRVEEWLAVRIALKQLMLLDGLAESPLHIHIRKAASGEPYVVIYHPKTHAYARYACSLSHKGPLVMAAYSRDKRCRVGVDLERRSWRLSYLRRRYLAEDDQLLDKADGVGDCAILWSLKEATSKVLGVGMGYGFKNLICRETSVGVCEIHDRDGHDYVGMYGWFGHYVMTIVTDVIRIETVEQPRPVKRVGRNIGTRWIRAWRLRELQQKRRKDMLSAVEQASELEKTLK